MFRPEPINEILFEERGKVAIITLNQPKKLNALTQDLYFHISQLLRYIDTRDDLFITILTAKGRFFSAGADVTSTSQANQASTPSDTYKQWLSSFVAANLNVGHAFYTHSKILISALNGPVVGLTAAVVAHADFIYAAPHAYLLVPFSSLGLAAEGLASVALMRRLGPARGNEALLMSKRISCEEMVACGFVNKVFDVRPGEDGKFLELVLAEVEERLGSHIVPESLVKIKALIRGPERELYDAQGVKEVFSGLQQFMRGVPQEKFRKIASGEKRHKL